ncbi:MAG: hypothetical protein Q8N03_10305 [Ignavibacteria bacterium]|nr:hypothetical protein [Ignavibacteria bacterium]MDP3831597.1 hypothetical protein [Ignavibacteriaceae bacterium]
MNWYVETVKAYPIITAMIQFAILSTLGDMISKWVIQKRIFLPFTYKTVILKMLEWAFLAVCIKYAFVGFNYFVQGLVEKSLLPGLNYFWEAFAISATMNLQFGPFLVIMHRLLDNLIAKENNWANIDKGMYSLLWFWLPAHTITFMLPKPFQIGLAALWSVVLGLILGYYNSKKK